MIRKSVIKVSVFCISVLGLHFAASLLGWYSAFSHMDTILHFLGGMFLAYTWIVFVHMRYGRFVPGMQGTMTVIGFVLLGGIVWELFEFLAWTYLPTHALFFEFYSATVSDLLGDLVMDFLGGAVMMSVHIYRVAWRRHVTVIMQKK